MNLSRWGKGADLRWYLGVRCKKCVSPILFALEPVGLETVQPQAGKLVLTCSKDDCRHQADYTSLPVLRFQKNDER
jgi:hypothetical protein